MALHQPSQGKELFKSAFNQVAVKLGGHAHTLAPRDSSREYHDFASTILSTADKPQKSNLTANRVKPPFMRLKRNLREQIYRYVVVPPKGVFVTIAKPPAGRVEAEPNSMSLSIFLVSRQLGYEASKIFYHHSAFRFSIPANPHIDLKIFHLDLSRIRKCWLDITAGYERDMSTLHATMQNERVTLMLRAFATHLCSSDHNMEFLQIITKKCLQEVELNWHVIMHPLRCVRGVKHVWISGKISRSYRAYLEDVMTRGSRADMLEYEKWRKEEAGYAKRQAWHAEGSRIDLFRETAPRVVDLDWDLGSYEAGKMRARVMRHVEE